MATVRERSADRAGDRLVRILGSNFLIGDRLSGCLAGLLKEVCRPSQEYERGCVCERERERNLEGEREKERERKAARW